MCVMAGGAAACGVCHVACIIKISVIENSVNCRHISVGAKGVCACGAEVVDDSPLAVTRTLRETANPETTRRPARVSGTVVRW
jgi:hypothetical protein